MIINWNYVIVGIAVIVGILLLMYIIDACRTQAPQIKK